MMQLASQEVALPVLEGLTALILLLQQAPINKKITYRIKDYGLWFMVFRCKQRKQA